MPLAIVNKYRIPCRQPSQIKYLSTILQTTDGKNIQFVHTFNSLGVLIDDQMTFTRYYSLVKRRIENKIIICTRKVVDDRTALLIYKQAVLPLAEYMQFLYSYHVDGAKT